MKTLGLNLGTTKSGKSLKDGGVCIIDDDKIAVAIAEERVSRNKHAGGFECALGYCLSSTGYTLNDFDFVVVSSCCEDVSPRPIRGLESVEPVFIPSHHLSHAYSTFCVSPFEKALIIVMDGGGNVTGRQHGDAWWQNPREQNSYYVGEGAAIRLIERDFHEPKEVGFGEAYRSFTYYLGWHSAIFAGKTMALAAYGDPQRYDGVNLFDVVNGRLRCMMENDPFRPVEMVRGLSRDSGFGFDQPRSSSGDITQHHKDVAFLVQNQIEKAIIAKIRYLCEKTGLTDICIAGGVGLNCVANQRILEQTPARNIFVQPASGDDGQCLGNALYGYHSILGMPRRVTMPTAYLGRSYSNNEIAGIVTGLDGNQFRVSISKNIEADVARFIADGRIVSWFQGHSEFGPRSLGNRSILGDPRVLITRERLDSQVKHRESFRPYAPSVIEEFSGDYFGLSTNSSPFMLLAARAKANRASQIPAVVHEDGSARVQTVSVKENKRFYNVIENFRKLTGIPIVLNTSFNGSGEPIVETPGDAFRCFRDHNLDALAIGDYLIERVNESPEKEKSW